MTSKGATKMSDGRSETSCEGDAFMLSVASHARAHAGTGDSGIPATSDPDALEEDSMRKLIAEVARARRKFPGNSLLLAALFEEGGELAKELLQRGGKTRVQKEALQVACVAMRIYEEGDATFDHVTDAQAQK
jgi:hypothetical protein